MFSVNVPARKNLCPTSRLTAVVLQLYCSVWLFAGMSAGAQELEAMRQQFLRGNYAEVIKAAQKEVDDNWYRSDWRRLLVESLLTVGRYGEACTNANEGLNGYSSDIGMRLLARDAALFQNDLVGANRRLVEISTLLERRPPSAQGGEELVALDRKSTRLNSSHLGISY